MDLGGGEVKDEKVEVEDSEEVNQGKDPAQVLVIAPSAQVSVAEPIFMPSSNSEVANNLDFLDAQLAAEDIVEHSFN